MMFVLSVDQEAGTNTELLSESLSLQDTVGKQTCNVYSIARVVLAGPELVRHFLAQFAAVHGRPKRGVAPRGAQKTAADA